MTIWYKYPYSNLHDMNLDWILEEIKRLSEAVDQLDPETLYARLDALQEAITAQASTIAQYGIDINSLTSQLSSLSSQVGTNTGDIANIKIALNNIDQLLAPIESEISSLSADVTAMGSQVSSNTGRIEALEDATLNAPTEANENLIVGQFQNLENLDYEIVKVTDNGSDTDNIQVVSGLIRMLPQPAYNEMALVIKNVLPNLVGTFTSSQILSFGLKYKTSGSNNGTDYCVNVPYTSLTGSSPYVANTGYTQTRASLRVLQLKPSADGKSHDLWIYNRYHGNYGILAGANIDILAMAMVFRGFDSSFSTTTIKAYFTTVYGNKACQVGALIDKKSPDIIQEAYDRSISRAQSYDFQTLVTATTRAFEYANQYSALSRPSGYAPEFIENDGSVYDILLNDYSYRSDVQKATFNGGGVDYYINCCNLFLNGYFEIPDNTFINKGGNWTEVGEVIIKDEDDEFLKPDYPVHLNAYCNLGLSDLPAQVEMVLDTDRKLKFRVSFDDTNYDWNSRTLVLRYSGFAQLNSGVS